MTTCSRAYLEADAAALIPVHGNCISPCPHFGAEDEGQARGSRNSSGRPGGARLGFGWRANAEGRSDLQGARTVRRKSRPCRISLNRLNALTRQAQSGLRRLSHCQGKIATKAECVIVAFAPRSFAHI